MKLLNIDEINKHLLQLNYVTPLTFYLFKTIDSTNSFLKMLEQSETTSVCLAEKQTQGRGRLERQWVSPFGVNIYLSTRWNFNCCLAQLSGLSLVVGLSIHSCLQAYGINDLWIKWPNDLIWQNKKLGGILIEITGEPQDNIQVIIGIGLNVNMSSTSYEIPENDWCSLQDITKKLVDRNQLIANLLFSLTNNLNTFIEKGFNFFHEQWNKADYLRGHYISLSHPTGLKYGYAKGVSEEGHLLLIEDSGEKQVLSAGDTSLIRKMGLPQA